MIEPFIPPGVGALTEIDGADVTYAAEVADVRGLIKAGSGGGWSNEGYFVNCITFAVWRVVGGPIVQRELTILQARPADDHGFDDYSDNTIHRMRLVLDEERTRAVFHGTVDDADHDAELVAAGQYLSTPLAVSTESFGRFELDRRFGCFETSAVWAGEEVRLVVPAVDESPSQEALATATALWSEEASWRRRIDDYMVENLLPLKNDTWLEEGEPELTAEQFLARPKPTTIDIDEEQEIEVWHHDGDLFWGHSILIGLTLEDGPHHWDIPG